MEGETAELSEENVRAVSVNRRPSIGLSWSTGAMPENDAVAQQLLSFITAIEEKVRPAAAFPSQVNITARRRRAPTELEICENFLSALSPEERSELGRIVQKMLDRGQ